MPAVGTDDGRTTAVLVGAVTEPGELSATVLVPAQDPAPPPGRGPEFGNASPIGLVVILLLLLATIVLIRSMSRRIRRLPASFDEPGSDDSDERDGTDGTDRTGDPDGAAPAGEPGEGSAGSDRPARG